MPLGARVIVGIASGVLLLRCSGFCVVGLLPGQGTPQPGCAAHAAGGVAAVAPPSSPSSQLGDLLRFVEPGGGDALLLAAVPPVPARTPITQPLLTGVAAVDLLAPMCARAQLARVSLNAGSPPPSESGRGQCMLLLGEPCSGKAALAADAAASAGAAGVRCVWSSSRPATRPAPHGAQAVCAPPAATPAQAYMALCCAFAVAEAGRDAGEDVLLVADDCACAPRLWAAAAALVPAPAPGPGADMVQFDGMLVAASSAERRSFFSALLQRCARLNATHGGGSLTLLALQPTRRGEYAFGAGAAASGRAVMDTRRRSGAAYATLSPELKAKLLAGIEREAGRAHSGAASEGEDSVSRQARGARAVS